MAFEPLKELKHILLRLINGDIVHRGMGICGHAQDYWNESLGEYCTYHGYCEDLPYSSTSVDQFMGLLMSTWPEGTGSERYPIPASKGSKCVISAENVFMSTDDKWQGNQLTLRHSLIDYMIEELNKIAGDMDDFIY